MFELVNEQEVGQVVQTSGLPLPRNETKTHFHMLGSITCIIVHVTRHKINEV